MSVLLNLDNRSEAVLCLFYNDINQFDNTGA